ncbi:MAG: serine/threonine protein kinase [Labilithrix sp.]|nr:serine/threonine protein kinase [Labilithrix sp.]
MADELPILIAALSEEKARELDEASRLGRNVWIPLKWEPAQPGPHLLEVYTPNTQLPMRLLAEPLGTSTEQGSPLRIYPWEEEEPETATPSFPDVAPDPVVGRSLAGGRFEIVSVLGEGSIGAVYRARHTGLGIVVAVKVLHDAFQRDVEFCRRFYAEALALSRLDHTNLVHIYDFGQEPDGLLYLSMAYVDGVTLRAIQQREKRFEVPRIASLMLQISAGLGHAHTRGLIHRDVKPDNVMIVAKEDDDGNRVETVKVLDFGFAVPPSVSGEVAQRLAGTPVYMSPEQCLGEELDARSDVYACGIMMYELATGTVPFLAHDTSAIRQMQVSMAAPLVSATRPDIDPRFDRLVQKALSKRREDRHPSMRELRAELRSLLAPEAAPPSLRASGSFERASVSSPPAPRQPSAPDWLESRAEGYARFMDEARATTPAHSIADSLAKDPSTWVGEVARERDLRALGRKLAELDGAVRILAQRADARTLQRVANIVTALQERAVDDDAIQNTLAAVARLFVDPEILAPIAASLLSPQEEARDAATAILAQARVAGAYALYGARTKVAADGPARVAFVTTMKALGDGALPVVRAALERIREQALSGEHRAATELAEDLLLSMPRFADEVAGQLVVKYAGSGVANLCRAAARALPRVWGERARPVLLHLLAHEDDGVLLAAIVGLREIDAVDAQAVARISAQVTAGRARTPQLRSAIVTALQEASDGARREAAAIVELLMARG